MNYFKYGKNEIDHLKKVDPIMGETISRIGMLKREIEPHIFSALISSIISQQISTKAADTVEKRLVNLVGNFDPYSLNPLSVEEIQKCGMSHRKAGYIKGVVEAAINKTVDFDNLNILPDEDIIKILSSLKGVGEWTAEMLLIHSLQRPNVLSYKDLGIRRGMMRLYGLESVSKTEFENYRKIYSPYGTVASIYLWEISRD